MQGQRWKHRCTSQQLSPAISTESRQSPCVVSKAIKSHRLSFSHDQGMCIVIVAADLANSGHFRQGFDLPRNLWYNEHAQSSCCGACGFNCQGACGVITNSISVIPESRICRLRNCLSFTSVCDSVSHFRSFVLEWRSSFNKWILHADQDEAMA